MAKTPKKDDTPETPVDENSLNISVDDGAPAPAGNLGPTEAQNEPQPEDGGPMLNVLAQYIRDMSFENPGAPDALRSGQEQPEVSIDLRIGRQMLENNTIEMSILVKAQATRAGQTLFIAELDYAGLFAIQNVNMEQVQPLIMIECPRILFPYARKILADMTQDGGYMPIMLDMPDFTSMYREEMMRRAQEQGVN